MYENKIQEYINKNFRIIYAVAYLCPTYLIGGSLRDLNLGKNPKDMDIVCLDNDNIIESFLEKFNLTYKINSLGGYKINYNGIEIDLWKTKDLFSAMEYNVDGLFYDISNNQLLSFSYNDFLENGLKKLNPENNIANGRVKKLQKYYNQIKQVR